MGKPVGRKRLPSPWLAAGVKPGRIFPESETIHAPAAALSGPARKRVLVAPRNTMVDARGNLRTLPGGSTRRTKFIEAVTRKMKAQEKAAARAKKARRKVRMPSQITARQLLKILDAMGYKLARSGGGHTFTCAGRNPIHIQFTEATKEINLRTTSLRWVAPLVREFLENGHTL